MKLVRVLQLLFLAEVYSVQDYYIIEREAKDDKFTIPRSICTNPVNYNYCNDKGAKQFYDDDKVVECTCQCDVFGFFNNTWKCQSNSNARSQAGCSVVRTNEMNSPLKVVPAADKWIANFKINSLNCSLQDQFSYLDCDGTWKQINKTDIGFYLYPYDDEPYLYGLTDNGNESIASYKPKIFGRIIKLNIECKAPKYYNCVMLKVSGSLQCPVLIPTTASSTMTSSTAIFSSSLPKHMSSASTTNVTPQPLMTTTMSTTSPSTMTTTMSTTSPSTMTIAVSTTSSSVSKTLPRTLFTPATTYSVLTSQRPSKWSLPISLTQSIFPTARQKRTTKSPETTEPLLKNGKKGASTDYSTSAVAGTVGVTGSLVIIIVILIIFKMNRNRNPATIQKDPEEDKDPNDYEQPVDNNLMHTGQQSSNGQKRFPEDPVYLTLEDPGHVRPEPVYDVLVGPGNEESNYDVVGGIIPNDIPVYDVLEGPESVGQQNSYLESHEPHIYGPLNSSGAGDHFISPSSQKTSVYQELNPNTRKSADHAIDPSVQGVGVYQKLNPETRHYADDDCGASPTIQAVGVYQEINPKTRQSSHGEYQPLRRNSEIGPELQNNIMTITI